MLHETIAALVFISLVWVNSVVFYIKEASNFNGWFMLFNAGGVALATHKLLERLAQ